MLCLFRFIVRDFVYNEEEVNAGKNELSKLVSDKRKQFVSNVVNRRGHCLNIA